MKFDDVLKQAVADLSANGFQSPQQILFWTAKLREAAKQNHRPGAMNLLRRSLQTLFRKAIRRLPDHILRFGPEHLEARLRPILESRIMASADLIVLNRSKAVDTILTRFSGWASSIPPGGSPGNKTEIKAHIAKPLRQMNFEERRLSIDQGHKLIANINQTIAEDNNAIALIWRHVHQQGYDSRPEHVALDGKLFVLRDNWAIQKGLMRKGGPYYDEIEGVSVAPFCRCHAEYLYNLRDLPPEYLSLRGRDALDKTRL